MSIKEEEVIKRVYEAFTCMALGYIDNGSQMIGVKEHVGGCVLEALCKTTAAIGLLGGLDPKTITKKVEVYAEEIRKSVADQSKRIIKP